MVLDRLFVAHDTGRSELLIQSPPSEHTLRDVRSVETIHAICPDHTLLLR